MKFVIKKLVLPVLYHLGMFHVLSGISRRRKVILMYHGLTSDNNSFQINPRHIPVNVFRKHLRFLQRNFTIVSMDEYKRRVTRDDNSRERFAAITFDDGYKNNLQAVPVAEKVNAPFTIYIITGKIGGDEIPMPDQIDHMIDHTSIRQVHFANEDFAFHRLHGRKKFRKQVFQQYRNIPENQRAEFVNEIAMLLGFPEAPKQVADEQLEFLTEEDIKYLSNKDLVTLGSHTVNHKNLLRSTPEEIDYEMEQSKEVLSTLTGNEIIHFSYPFGLYDKCSKERVKRYYETATAIRPTINKSGEDLFEIERLGLYAVSSYYEHILQLVLHLFKIHPR